MKIQQRNKTYNITDELSFKEFVEAYSNDLLYYARYIIHSKEEAEEIVSDVFVDVWMMRDKLHEKRNIKAWLLTMTHNRSISYLRKKCSRPDAVSLDEVEYCFLPDDLQTPDERMISQEEMARINHAINQLPPRSRQVFILAKIERLPYKEISEILGISVKTINNHIANVLIKITEILKKY